MALDKSTATCLGSTPTDLAGLPMASPTPSTRLRDRTLLLLRELPRHRTLKEVADECDLKLSWLTAFARGEIDHPSVNRIEKLYEHLTGRKLKVD
jgi:hypothetical protein